MEEVKNGLVLRIKAYIKETQAEAKKVSWPDRRYVWAATSIIVVMVIAISAALMLIDFGLSNAILMLTRTR